MGSVRTPIIGGPRPTPGSTRRYTLNCEEPHSCLSLHIETMARNGRISPKTAGFGEILGGAGGGWGIVALIALTCGIAPARRGVTVV